MAEEAIPVSVLLEEIMIGRESRWTRNADSQHPLGEM